MPPLLYNDAPLFPSNRQPKQGTYAALFAYAPHKTQRKNKDFLKNIIQNEKYLYFCHVLKLCDLLTWQTCKLFVYTGVLLVCFFLKLSKSSKNKKLFLLKVDFVGLLLLFAWLKRHARKIIRFFRQRLPCTPIQAFYSIFQRFLFLPTFVGLFFVVRA